MLNSLNACIVCSKVQTMSHKISVNVKLSRQNDQLLGDVNASLILAFCIKPLAGMVQS